MSDEKKVTVMGTVEIFILSDGNVSVKGPINNPVVMMNIFGRAITVVANYVAAKEMEGQADIVVPA